VRRWRLSCQCLLGATTRQNGEHRPTLHRGWPFDDGNVGNAGGDATNLVASHLGVRRLASPESHLDLYFVPLLEESTSRPDPHLQVVIVGAGSNAYFLYLRNVLILFGVSSPFVRLELEFPKVGNATHGRLCGSGDLDQVQTGFFRTADGLFNWQNTNLLTVRVKDADFGSSNLAIGTRTSRGRRARNEWWTRNRRFSLLTTRQILGILENVKLLRPVGTPVSRPS
jgi:hypothetical protein